MSSRQETGELRDNGDRNWKNADIGRGMLRFLYESPGKYQGRFSLEPPEGSGPCQHAEPGPQETSVVFKRGFMAFHFYSIGKQANS